VGAVFPIRKFADKEAVREIMRGQRAMSFDDVKKQLRINGYFPTSFESKPFSFFFVAFIL